MLCTDEELQTPEVNNEFRQTLGSDDLKYISAIKSKPFLILAGISGTGKSRIVRKFAYQSCPTRLQGENNTAPKNYCMIEVKPNWHDSTELLGYYSSIEGHYKVMPFIKFVVQAWLNQDVPFFVCLDEMNLAPVEQYFAEFLSVFESRTLADDGITIVTDPLIKKEILFSNGLKESLTGTSLNITDDSNSYTSSMPDIDSIMRKELGLGDGSDDDKIFSSVRTKGLTLPPNLIIIGTVNMDDTTYQFSRKVIDRAMTIEMNGGDLTDMFDHSEDLSYRNDNVVLPLANFMPKYTNADQVLKLYPEFAVTIKGNTVDNMGLPYYLNEINRKLGNTPFQVSYRVLNEMVIYLGVLMDEKKEQGEMTEDILPSLINETVDRIMLMKILPRIEGDKDVFKDGSNENKLKQLSDFCNMNKFEASEKKVQEMSDRLESSDFTRFWP